MKKVKRSLILSMMLLFISVMVIGCSSKPKVGADETGQILFDFYIKGDKESLSKIKIPKEEIEKIAKMQKDQTILTIKNNLTVAGLKVNNEQIKQIYEARVAALKKLSAKTEVVSEDDKSAQVKFKLTYINERKIDEKAATDAIEEIKKLNITDRQEAINKATDLYIKNLIKSYQNVKPSSDMREQTFKFAIEEKTWLPQDMEKFGTDIVKLTSTIK